MNEPSSSTFYACLFQWLPCFLVGGYPSAVFCAAEFNSSC